MSVAELEKAVSGLSAEELQKFRLWFSQFDEGKWDEQMEADARAGRLDTLAAEALDDLKSSRCTDL